MDLLEVIQNIPHFKFFHKITINDRDAKLAYSKAKLLRDYNTPAWHHSDLES